MTAFAVPPAAPLYQWVHVDIASARAPGHHARDLLDRCLAGCADER